MFAFLLRLQAFSDIFQIVYSAFPVELLDMLEIHRLCPCGIARVAIAAILEYIGAYRVPVDY